MELRQHLEISEHGHLLKIIGIFYFQSKLFLKFYKRSFSLYINLNRISMGGIVSNIASKFNTKSSLDDVSFFKV